MADGIKLEGFDEFEDMLSRMNITDKEERSILENAVEPAFAALERDAPRGKTGKLSNIKFSIKKVGFATTATLRVGAYWGMFQEFGTSYQKAHVGFFERSIKSTEDKVINEMSKELFKKIV